MQDEIRYDASAKRFGRSSNRAGGIEGGITNGQDVVVRGYLKPISTLRRALLTADLHTKESVKAAYERSDVCVVPAGGVVGEAMVAFELACAFLEKFGGDSLEETRRNFDRLPAPVGQFFNSRRLLALAAIHTIEMIHPIVKFSDPVLETPTKPVAKFRRRAAGARRRYVRIHVRRSRGGLGCAADRDQPARVAVIDVSNGKNAEAKIVCANPANHSRRRRAARGRRLPFSVPGFPRSNTWCGRSM